MGGGVDSFVRPRVGGGVPSRAGRSHFVLVGTRTADLMAFP